MTYMAGGQWLLLAGSGLGCFTIGAIITYVLDEIHHDHINHPKGKP